MEFLEEQLDEENEKLFNQFEDTLGFGKNQAVLRDIIRYHQVLQKGDYPIDFENYNIVIRNESNYFIYEDLISVIAKVYMKNGITKNDKIYYLSRRRFSKQRI